MSYLFEAVHNSVFTGTCTKGEITVTGYYDTGASIITANSLRTSSVIINRRLVGYVANNTKWINGGFSAYLSYREYTAEGICEIQFIFPYGRTYLVSTPVNMKSVCVLPSVSETEIMINSQPSIPNNFFIGIKLCTNTNNTVSNAALITGPQPVVVKGGTYFGNY
jgi:hypothetical protein